MQIHTTSFRFLFVKNLEKTHVLFSFQVIFSLKLQVVVPVSFYCVVAFGAHPTVIKVWADSVSAGVPEGWMVPVNLSAISVPQTGPRIVLSAIFHRLRTQIILCIHSLNRPLVAQTQHSLLCLSLSVFLCFGCMQHCLHSRWDNKCRLLSPAHKQRPDATQANWVNAQLQCGESTIRFREKKRNTDSQKKRKTARGRGAKKRERRWKVKYSLFFFGCCTSCGALFLDLLVRGERLKKILSKRKEGRKG